MKLHTELFRLRRLLLEELAEGGCLPFRDVDTVEVDLTGGELVLTLRQRGLELFPLLARFCRHHGLQVSSWDTEEGVCHLSGRRGGDEEKENRPTRTRDDGRPGGEGRGPIRSEYARAVRAAFADPADDRARLQAGRLAWSLGRPDHATHWYLEAAGAGGSRDVQVEAWLWAGICLHLETGRGDRRLLARAFRCYRSVLELDPDNFFALLNLGKLTMLMGRYPVARTLLRRALQVNPGDNEAAALLGRLDGR